ncbi:hypothetical protein ACFQZ2_21260 [Streptomonospora algeriensis]|uniref:Uncharacterized protein n=1 Tax=Streptomonospora algeriensis TaxID=995084 RepID=A0ABW3BFA2_9ACTN
MRPQAEEPDRQGPSQSERRAPWELVFDGDDSLVIENFTAKEGKSHTTAFHAAQGEPAPCDAVPLIEWGQVSKAD